MAGTEPVATEDDSGKREENALDSVILSPTQTKINPERDYTLTVRVAVHFGRVGSHVVSGQGENEDSITLLLLNQRADTVVSVLPSCSNFVREDRRELFLIG